MVRQQINWPERIAKFREKSERLDSYGNHACGCTWDSGPYGVHCEHHDPDGLAHDLLRELTDAREKAYGSVELVQAAREYLKDAEPPT